MKKNILFTSPLIVLLLMACNEKQDHNPIEFQPGVSFDLSYKDTGNCNCGDLSVTFADVLEDSRCPVPATCFWEGEARVQLDIQAANESQSIELIFQASRSSFDRDTVGNYAISLMQVSPHPKDGQTIEKQDYDIRLMVEEL